MRNQQKLQNQLAVLFYGTAMPTSSDYSVIRIWFHVWQNYYMFVLCGCKASLCQAPNCDRSRTSWVWVRFALMRFVVVKYFYFNHITRVYPYHSRLLHHIQYILRDTWLIFSWFHVVQSVVSNLSISLSVIWIDHAISWMHWKPFKTFKRIIQLCQISE